MVFCKIAKKHEEEKLRDADREKKRFHLNDDLSKSLCEPRGGAAPHVVTNTDNWIKAKKTFISSIFTILVVVRFWKKF